MIEPCKFIAVHCTAAYRIQCLRAHLRICKFCCLDVLALWLADIEEL